MGQTENYGIPYPECDKPLRADAADIADFRDLAVAADDALTGVYARATQLVFAPDSVRMATGAAVAGVGQLFTPVFNVGSISQGNGMSDTGNGWINLVEPGRYWIGTYTAITAAGMTAVRTRFLLGGVVATNYQTPGAIVTGNVATGQAQAVIGSNAPNTPLQVQVRHSASSALAYTYTSRIWAVQLLRY